MTAPSENAPSPLPDAAGAKAILSGLKGFFVWLAGSIAGISAVLYAVGFLVTRAHLSMLGLYGFVAYSNDVFLQEGAKFFIVVGHEVLRGTAAPLLSLFAVFAALCFALQPLLAATRLAAWCKRRLRGVGDAIYRLGKRMSIPPSTLRELLRRAVFVALLFVALEYAGDALGPSISPLCLSNLLYAGAHVTQCPASLQEQSNQLLAMVTSANSDGLSRAFYDLFYTVATLVIASYLAWRVAQPWRYRSWFISPLIAVSLLFVILLPMDYGVLQRPVSYPRIELAPDLRHETGRGVLFLMNKGSGEFVLWDESAKQLLWIPTSGLTGAEIKGVEDLFGRPVAATAAEGSVK